ncbi:hypothetical protein TPAU25S_03223 [Tsukamurella paurometabola]|uniref:DUF456 domain-containing protein n=1 Tax=Tsukamurella paurometabola (strain ATCC 8368 / DSM 20162 / CCUG 35730 / CIP 100753 / JCM 10117 / KCTC 9821 / NBRC 16120 / NCIMB 702349 / NCTC 13040) TaxID=521096 RepID=D5UM25_TSUPD|nr:DUF456 domain-containing protein [Tsukamurella paurometabola]ADG78305.1 protein of unknown function DUF456 [Tsukamurella paurometabola DSM 20162]SUP31126.1 Protein of uncharacterised function (DUF456) [Tsukamurella paurometabola]
MNSWGYVAVVALMVLGLLGIVIPVLPGSTLVALGILIWAIFTGGSAWGVFAAALAVMVLAWAIKYFVGHRTMAKAGVGKWSLVAGGVTGIVLFFVIPVIGLLIGFILGTFVAEAVRLKDVRAGWTGAIAATKAAGLLILIELAGALCAVSIWLYAVLA